MTSGTEPNALSFWFFCDSLRVINRSPFPLGAWGGLVRDGKERMAAVIVVVILATLFDGNMRKEAFGWENYENE